MLNRVGDHLEALSLRSEGEACMSGNQRMGAENKGKRKKEKFSGELATIPKGEVVRIAPDPPDPSPEAKTAIFTTTAELDLTRDGLSTNVVVPPQQGADLLRSWILVVGMSTSVGGALGALWLAPAAHLAGGYLLGAVALAGLSPIFFCLLATVLLCKD